MFFFSVFEGANKFLFFFPMGILRVSFVCLVGDFFADSIPWDENHNFSPPFGEYCCHFFQPPNSHQEFQLPKMEES